MYRNTFCVSLCLHFFWVLINGASLPSVLTPLVFSSKPLVKVRRQASSSDCPGVYNFGLDELHIVDHRSVKYDTIWLAASLAINGRDTINITGSYGQHGNGLFNPRILFPNIPLADDEVAILSYVVVNDGHHSRDEIDNLLIQAAVGLAERGVQYGIQFGTESIGIVIAREIGDIVSRVLGFIFLVLNLAQIFITGCDGWLAAGVHGFAGADLCLHGLIEGTDQSLGHDVETVAGIPGIVCSTTQSDYEISWYGGNSSYTGRHLKAMNAGEGRETLLYSKFWWTVWTALFSLWMFL